MEILSNLFIITYKSHFEFSIIIIIIILKVELIKNKLLLLLLKVYKEQKNI